MIFGIQLHLSALIKITCDKALLLLQVAGQLQQKILLEP